MSGRSARGVLTMVGVLSILLALGEAPVDASVQVAPDASPTDPVSCSPAPSATIAVLQVVTCSFAAPSGGGTFLGWSAADFEPPTSTTASQSFEAVSSGQGAITVSWKNSEGVTETGQSNYTITPSTAIASCTSGNGASVEVDKTVSCTFNGQSGDTFDGWGASLLSPNDSTSTTQSFTALTTGSGSITAFWTDSTDAEDQETFSYSLVPNPSIATCSVPSGQQVNVVTTVSCTFKGLSGQTFVGWGGSLFSPSDSTSTTQTFTPLALGAGSITAFWDVGGVENQESFTYQVAKISAFLGPVCAEGQTVSLNGAIEWTNLNPGTFVIKWGDGSKTSKASFPAWHVYTSSGTDTIEVVAADHGQTATASAKVTVGAGRKSCSYSMSPSPIAATGSLKANAKVQVTISVSSGGVVQDFAPLWLEFIPATGGGKAGVASGTSTVSLTSSPQLFTTSGSGQMTITYRCPKKLPKKGDDEIVLLTSPSKGKSVVDRYRY